MPRPQRLRRIRTCTPPYTAFKPARIPSRNLEKIVMSLDEFESICLTDCEALYQEDAAAKMGVSRQTFGNILLSARKKIADMLIQGKMLVIEGGNVCCCADGTHHQECCSQSGPRDEEAVSDCRSSERQE